MNNNDLKKLIESILIMTIIWVMPTNGQTSNPIAVAPVADAAQLTSGILPYARLGASVPVLTPTSGNKIVGNGAAWVLKPETIIDTTAVANIPVLTPTTGNRIVGNGSAWILKPASVIDVTDPAYGAVADGDGIGGGTDNATAFAAAFTALATKAGGTLKVPAGTYRIGTALDLSAVSGIKIVGEGSSLHATQNRTTILDFSGSLGTYGIAINTCNGVVIEDIHFQMGIVANTSAIYLLAVTGFEINRVTVASASGTGTYGIKIGTPATPAHACIVGSISQCVIQCVGTPIYIGDGCTAIGISSCYALGQSTYGYHFQSCTYSTLLNCAADTGTATGWGYGFEGVGGITQIACGAENNGLGHTRIFGGSIGVEMFSPRGVGNNTAASVAIGSLVDIGATGTNYNVLITNPRDTAPNIATVRAIWGRLSTLHTTIINAETTQAMAAGNYTTDVIGGDATWYRYHMNMVGGTAGAYFNNIVTPGSLRVGNGANNYFVSDAGICTPSGTAEMGIPYGITLPTGFNGSLAIDSDASINGTLYVYSNAAWRVVQALP